MKGNLGREDGEEGAAVPRDMGAVGRGGQNYTSRKPGSEQK